MASLFLVKLEEGHLMKVSEWGGWRFKKKVLNIMGKNRIAELFEGPVESENHAFRLTVICEFVWNFSRGTEQCGYYFRKGGDLVQPRLNFSKKSDWKTRGEEGWRIRKWMFIIRVMEFNLDREGSERERGEESTKCLWETKDRCGGANSMGLVVRELSAWI